MLFEPDKKWTGGGGGGGGEVRNEDSLVQPNSEGEVKLVIHNPSHEAKILGDSIHMGSAQPLWQFRLPQSNLLME